MFLKQLSVFIENKPGRLAEVIGFISEAGINIHALSIADTTDFGILRLIVANVEHAKAILKEKGCTVKTTDVVAVSLEHKVGSLHNVLVALEKADVSIEYMYAFTSRSEDHDAMVILSLTDQENAVKRIEEIGLKLIGADVIKELNV